MIIPKSGNFMPNFFGLGVLLNKRLGVRRITMADRTKYLFGNYVGFGDYINKAWFFVKALADAYLTTSPLRVVFYFISLFAAIIVPMALAWLILPIFFGPPPYNNMSDFWALFTVSLILLYCIPFSIWMFRGGSWAGTISAKAKTSPIPEDDLRSRLLSFNDLDLPFSIKEDKCGKLIAEWQITNSNWATLMELAGLEMAHRVVLELDEVNNIVRARDEEKEISWSAGVAKYKWSANVFVGIDFFQYDRAAELGLVIKDGKPQIGLAYNYRFYLAEMKNPIIDTITQSGWTYRPVVSFIRAISG